MNKESKKYIIIDLEEYDYILSLNKTSIPMIDEIKTILLSSKDIKCINDNGLTKILVYDDNNDLWLYKILFKNFLEIKKKEENK